MEQQQASEAARRPENTGHQPFGASPASPVVITGRGVLSPLGCDYRTFAEAVRAGRQATPQTFPSQLPADPPSYYPLACREEDLPTRVPTQRTTDLLTVMTIEAVRQALEEAAFPAADGPLDAVGLIVNTMFGPSGPLEDYLERVRDRGPIGISPSLFLDTLPNMPASRAGIAFRIRGSSTVINGTSPFELALDWLRAGREPLVIAGGAEHLSTKCLRLYRAVCGRGDAGTRPTLAQGAAFVALEKPTHARARGAHIIGDLLGAGAASEPQERATPWSQEPSGRALAWAMEDALIDSGLGPADIDGVTLCAADPLTEATELTVIRSVFGPRAESLTLLRPKRLLAEGLAASAGLGLLATLATLEAGRQSATFLVNALEMGGAVSSLVVRAPGAVSRGENA